MIALTPPKPPSPPAPPDDPPARLIVTYKTQTAETEKENLISKFGAEKLKRLQIVNSAVVITKTSQIGEIRNNPKVLRVEKDARVQALQRYLTPTQPPTR